MEETEQHPQGIKGEALLQEEDIEAEAREMLRQAILRSGWYPGLPQHERSRRIEQDVDHHWPVMRQEAVKRLAQHQGS